MAQSFCFAGYPAVVLVDDNGKAVTQKLWGSSLPLTGNKNDGLLEVAFGSKTMWVHESETQNHGLLEVMFLDIGQGDGCLINIPQPDAAPRRMIIDAGAGDNMVRFLNVKYRYSAKPVKFESFVITHPDKDHYFGFDKILDDADFEVETIYHSGLVERVAPRRDDTLGKREKFNGRSYLVNLVSSLDELDNLLKPSKIGRKQYPVMMRKAVDSTRVDDIRMINASDGFLPKCGANDDFTLEVLGPVPENVNGSQALRWLSDFGKTKNGHSIVLRLKYGEISFLVGGDLNIPAEDYLLEHYTGELVPPRDAEGEERLIKKARKIFQSDFAKACHHGSADFTETFLKAVNAHATVISSGDDEPHAHPRADTLGTIGKHSRGRRSMIFSTELARSTKDTIYNAEKFREQIRVAAHDVADAKANGTAGELTTAEKRFEKLLEKIQRSVTTYGAINMRTDGDKAIFAYKIERPKSKKSQWDIYKFERDTTGELVIQSRH